MGPHVVMVPIFAAGHCTPFLIFAKGLAAAGVTVTVVSSDKHISELIHRHCGSLHELPIRFAGLRDGAENLNHIELFMKRQTAAGREQASRLLVELITEMISSKAAPQLRGAGFPVCVLHDKDAGWAQDAAQKLRIEKHLLYVSNVACLSIGLQV